MSRSTYISRKELKTEIGAGIHLLTIKDVKTTPIDDSYISLITFAGNDMNSGLIHQELFKTESSKLFKLLRQCDCDPSQVIMKKDIVGKKVFGYIRAVQKVIDYKVSGEPTFELFDTSPYVDGMKPVHSDSPELNEGRFVGEFIMYQDEVTA